MKVLYHYYTLPEIRLLIGQLEVTSSKEDKSLLNDSESLLEDQEMLKEALDDAYLLKDETIIKRVKRMWIWLEW